MDDGASPAADALSYAGQPGSGRDRFGFEHLFEGGPERRIHLFHRGDDSEVHERGHAVEENAEIETLLWSIRELPIDTKTGKLKTILRELRDGGISAKRHRMR